MRLVLVVFRDCAVAFAAPNAEGSPAKVMHPKAYRKYIAIEAMTAKLPSNVCAEAQRIFVTSCFIMKEKLSYELWQLYRAYVIAT